MTLSDFHFCHPVRILQMIIQVRGKGIGIERTQVSGKINLSHNVTPKRTCTPLGRVLGYHFSPVERETLAYVCPYLSLGGYSLSMGQIRGYVNLFSSIRLIRGLLILSLCKTVGRADLIPFDVQKVHWPTIPKLRNKRPLKILTIPKG